MTCCVACPGKLMSVRVAHGRGHMPCCMSRPAHAKQKGRLWSVLCSPCALEKIADLAERGAEPKRVAKLRWSLGMHCIAVSLKSIVAATSCYSQLQRSKIRLQRMPPPCHVKRHCTAIVGLVAARCLAGMVLSTTKASIMSEQVLTPDGFCISLNVKALPVLAHPCSCRAHSCPRGLAGMVLSNRKTMMASALHSV